MLLLCACSNDAASASCASSRKWEYWCYCHFHCTDAAHMTATTTAASTTPALQPPPSFSAKLQDCPHCPNLKQTPRGSTSWLWCSHCLPGPRFLAPPSPPIQLSSHIQATPPRYKQRPLFIHTLLHPSLCIHPLHSSPTTRIPTNSGSLCTFTVLNQDYTWHDIEFCSFSVFQEQISPRHNYYSTNSALGDWATGKYSYKKWFYCSVQLSTYRQTWY